MAQPSAELAQQFANLMAAGDYAGAARLGRSAGYSDAQIAEYTANMGFRDTGGNQITQQAAQQFLASPSNPYVAPTPAPAPQPSANLGIGSNTSAPTTAQANQFSGLLSSGNFQAAADFGRGLGYSDKDIANYVGSNQLKDNSGAAISTSAAQNFLTSTAPPARAPVTPSAPSTTAPQPSAALASQFANLMSKGDYQGAQNLGLSNGYTNAQIANYVGNVGTFKDANGRAITEQNANDFLRSPSQVRTPAPPPAAQPPAGQQPQLQQYQKNPYLDQMASGIRDQMNDNWTRNLAPSIRSGAMAAGGFGGSRQGVVEANALNDLNRSLGQNTTAMYATDYQNQMGRNLQQYQGDQQAFLSNKGLDNSYVLGGRGLDNQFTLGARSLDNQYNANQNNLGLGYAQLDSNIYNNNFNNSPNAANFGLNAYNTLNQNNQTGVNNANQIGNTPMQQNQYFSGQYQGYGGAGGSQNNTGTQGTSSNGAVQGLGLGVGLGSMFYPQR